MQNKPEIIHITLPTGDPSGLRIAELTHTSIKVLEVPRRDLNQFLKMQEAEQVGLYFLIGESEKEEVYIGQSGKVGTRLQQHHQDEKIDWERALVMISATQHLTQTDVLYLESLSIEKVKNCGRVHLLNNNSGQKPHMTTALQTVCDKIYPITTLLVKTLGYSFFEPLISARENNENPVFICPYGNVEAEATYTNAGMIVLKGSRFPYYEKNNSPAYRHRCIDKCNLLIAKKVLKKEGDTCLFVEDYLFSSPSSAAALLLLQNTNGWTKFKTKTGKTLRQVFDAK